MTETTEHASAAGAEGAAGAIVIAEERLRIAMLDNDIDVLDELIDAELLFTVPTGDVLGKADDLDARRSGAMRMTTLEPSEQRVTVHGTAAVVTVRMAMTGFMGDEPFGGSFRYTRFWVEKTAGWRVVGGHVSQLDH